MCHKMVEVLICAGCQGFNILSVARPTGLSSRGRVGILDFDGYTSSENIYFPFALFCHGMAQSASGGRSTLPHGRGAEPLSITRQCSPHQRQPRGGTCCRCQRW